MGVAINTKKCFVIIGYGEKIDLATQRRLNLDRVFENVIKPAFDSFEQPRFHCFRACDENYGGVLDSQMYKWILEADFVIADISTLNPNVIYELGIRHALRPFSTLVIAEEGIKEFPFDINHVKIERYKHLGEDIGVAEAKRFITILKSRIKYMLDNQSCDSPVYTFINKLRPPLESLQENNQEQDLDSESRKIENDSSSIEIERDSLTALLKKGEAEHRKKNYSAAKNLYKQAEERDPYNEFIKHNLIFCTYKAEMPDRQSALEEALSLLTKNFDLQQTVHPRTLELLSTITRRLAEDEYSKGENCNTQKALEFSSISIRAYEKAFILTRSYFVGSNFSSVLLLAALLELDSKRKSQRYVNSCLVSQRVYDATEYILNNNPQIGKSKKQTALEKKLQAKIILNKGFEDDEAAQLKEELKLLQNEDDSKWYNERLAKIKNRISILRKDLEDKKTASMYL